MIDIKVTELKVSLLPEDHKLHHLYCIFIQYRGNDYWSIGHLSMYFGKDGKWDHERKSDDNWVLRHRFDIDTARLLAIRNAPIIKVSGKTAREVLEGKS